MENNPFNNGNSSGGRPNNGPGGQQSVNGNGSQPQSGFGGGAQSSSMPGGSMRPQGNYQPMPGQGPQPMNGQPRPQGMPGQPMSGQPMPGQPVPGQNPQGMPGQPMPGQIPQGMPGQVPQAIPDPNDPNAPQDGEGSPLSPDGKPIKPRGPWMIIAIIFIILSLILGGGFGWALVQYLDYRDNTDYKISQAVADAEKKTKMDMQKKFEEESKSPYSLFVGPDDYGRVSFEYPRTWSAYVESEVASGGSKPFNAFFYPDVVPPVSQVQQFAVRMKIEDVDYDKTVNRYANQIRDGTLVSTPVQVGSLNGTRLDGFFSDDIRGAAVIFKVRDKTLTLRTDSNAFMSDFDTLIKTIKINE